MKRLLFTLCLSFLLIPPVAADTILRQSTTAVVPICLFRDSLDGVTPETTVSLSGADEAELLKAAGAATVSLASNTWTAITGADGCYHLTLTTTDTNTIGPLTVLVQDDSLILPRRERFQVIEEASYDNMYASGAVGPITAASVNAQVVDVVGTDTITLPGQTAPPATPTINQALGWIYKVLRNKADQTGSLWQLYNDAGTTVDAKRTVGDSGGTTTLDEIVTGP